MYRGGPDPDSSLHGTWYPARITSHLRGTKILFAGKTTTARIVRRTEQHIHPYFTPQRPRPHHRRMMLEDCESPPTYSAAGRRAQCRKKRKQRMDEEFGADRWRQRNLRPTPTRVDAYTARRSLSPSPPDLYVTPDPEPRRSSRIFARRSPSDTS